MKASVIDEIKRYVLEEKGNWCQETGDRYYDEPVVKFASPGDPVFKEYKKIIGQEHLTPAEAFETAFGEGSYSRGTVISVVLPVNEKIRKCNRAQKEWASKEWALLRAYGDDIFIGEFGRYMESFISRMGYKTVAPAKAGWFKIHGTPQGPSSNWSERHIAYAAGQGTFGINDGFITEKGIAIKLISFVTGLELTPDVREAKTHTDNCLLYQKGICGACIKRCPVGAISREGHDKKKCMGYVYGDESKKLAVAYGGLARVGSGCGLCQTNVPCEGRNPMKSGK